MHPGVARLIGSPRTREQRDPLRPCFAAGPGALVTSVGRSICSASAHPEDDEDDLIVVDRRRRPGDRRRQRPSPPAISRTCRPCCAPTFRLATSFAGSATSALSTHPSRNPAVGHVIAGGLALPRPPRAATVVHSRRGRPGVPALRAALDDWGARQQTGRQRPRADDAPTLSRFGIPPAQFHAIAAGYEVDFHFVGTWSSWNATDGSRTAATAGNSSSIGSATPRHRGRLRHRALSRIAS